jgi:hypothetical protein
MIETESVRLNLLARLINHDTVFFSHNKTASAEQPDDYSENKQDPYQLSL